MRFYADHRVYFGSNYLANTYRQNRNRNIEKNLFFVFLRFPENMPNGLKWGVHWLQSGFSDKY